MDFKSILSLVVVISCIASPVLVALCGWLGFLFFSQRSKDRREIQKLESRVAVISRTALNAMREDWFVEIQTPTYISELEVESKFVYPMMRYLGYPAADLRMRVMVDIRVGRQNMNGIADWVVYKKDVPYMVIEAKEKNQPLNTDAKEQARSYCFALNAPLYMLTNGRQVQLFRRGVDSDMMIFNSDVAKLPDNWSELYRVIGAVELV